MKTVFKKIIPLALVSAMALSLCSCTKNFDKTIKKANRALDEKAYTVEVDLDFECKDQEVSGIFEQIEAAQTTLYFKDGKTKVENAISIDYGAGKNSFKTVYTVIDGVIYSNMSYTTADGISKENKAKAFVTDEQVKKMIGEASFIGNLSGADFSESTKGNLDGGHLIVRSGALDSAKIILEDAMASQLEGACDSVALTEARMTVEIEDGKYDTVTVECTYSVTIQGKAYTVDAEVELEIDFDDSFDISVPADAESYGVTDAENVIG